MTLLFPNQTSAGHPEHDLKLRSGQRVRKETVGEINQKTHETRCVTKRERGRGKQRAAAAAAEADAEGEAEADAGFALLNSAGECMNMAA